MAANFGKFIDRSPNICAAGRSTGVTPSSVGRIIEDDAERKIAKQAGKIQIEDLIPIEHLLIKNGKEDSVSDTVNQDQKVDDAEGTGILDMKTPYKIMGVTYDMYRTTHDDYNRPKQIKEEHSVPLFLPGVKSAANPKGVWVRCVCEGHQDDESESNQIEAEFEDRHHSQLGKSLNPNHNIQCVPEGFTFGKASGHDSYGMDELLHDSNCPPCEFKRDFNKWVASLNKLRNEMRHRTNERDYHFSMFSKKCADMDKENTGFLPIDVLYDLCNANHLAFHKEDMEPLLKFLNIIQGDKINYAKFIQVVDVNKPAIDILPLPDVPKQNQYYETTSHAADYLLTHQSEMPASRPAAGLPAYEDFSKIPESPAK